MTQPKPFQQATIDAATKVLLSSKGSRRFLVADEVGLGKTIVAQRVIAKMMEGRSRPLRVFYVCSNLTIAAQNRRNLLKAIPEHERRQAICLVDRLTLLPAEDEPEHPRLHLYTLTPDTSIPMRQGRRRDGQQTERALIYALVEAVWPEIADVLPESLFRRNAETYWKKIIKEQRAKIDRDSRLKKMFRESVREEYGLESGQHLLPRILQEFQDRDSRDAELEIIARFRNALAVGALKNIHPDLVIFDEFQRFRDLIEEKKDAEIESTETAHEDAARRVIGKLQGGNDSSTALLLLSATPYSLYSKHWEDTAGRSHHKEFFDLIEFIGGGAKVGSEKRRHCERAFNEFAAELHRPDFSLERASALRARIESVLRPLMSRTERAALVKSEAEFKTKALEGRLTEADLKVFRHLVESVSPAYRGDCVPYWSSIPLPMQTMGSRYLIWENASPKRSSNVPKLTREMRDRFHRIGEWPHPKLRALMNLAQTKDIAVPWVAPSMPWWPLAGPWKQRRPLENRLEGKLLVFSRFRAVPQAVAAALSYEMECRTITGGKMAYSDVSQRRLMSVTGKRYPLLSMFHPSPFFAGLIDPLSTRESTVGAVRLAMRKQLIDALKLVGVSVSHQAGRPRPVWRLVAGIDARAGHGKRIAAGWEQLRKKNSRSAPEDDSESDSSAGGLGKLIAEWQAASERDVSSISHQELDELTNYAMAAPGVVFARAVMRHCSNGELANSYAQLLEAAWNGLRNYLDQRWFVQSLGANDKNYLQRLQHAVIDGNLESVLDEYFWYLVSVQGFNLGEVCEEFVAAASLRGGDVTFHNPETKNGPFSIRCHATLPFVDAKRAASDGSSVERPLRTDEIRRAFNSPFMPHVLITTSIGQEGLDFHPWCKTLVHWDLSNNPVDVEQREGRIQRYANLAVRRQLASAYRATVMGMIGETSGESPWALLARLAESESHDPSGLMPWWTFGQSDVERYVLDIPTSEQRQRLAQLKESRLLYRLALGQPNQEDFVDLLVRNPSLTETDLRSVMPRLSAWTDKEEK